MFGKLFESCEAAVAEVETLPFLDPQAVRNLWHSFVANRQHCYWMKPMLLVTLGNYIAMSRAAQA
jgi:hypothetical protein